MRLQLPGGARDIMFIEKQWLKLQVRATAVRPGGARGAPTPSFVLIGHAESLTPF